MSDQDNSKPNDNLDGSYYYNVASAGVAQSIALGSQNVIDELRNQSIVKTTAMGTAYAKWLANPQGGEQLFKPVIDSLNAPPSQTESVNGRVKNLVSITLSPATSSGNG